MDTYEELLNKMTAKFQELAGFSPDSASDIGIRMKVLAGEIYSLQTGIQWLKTQSFPQTATGEYLDLHAAQRGLSRKQAAPSSGVLTFGRAAALPYDTVIPADTVCFPAGETEARFLTAQDAVLSAGKLTVTVPARAQEGGRKTNAAAGTITMMMTPPAGIETVVNSSAFTGGTDAETDPELRKRLLQSYAMVSNGTNSAFYREYALSHDGVHSAGVKPRANGSGTVAVYVAGQGAAPDSAVVESLRAELNSLREINVDVTVAPAVLVQFDAGIFAAPAAGFPFAEVKEAVSAAVREYFASLSIGDPVVATALGQKIMETGLVRNYEFDTLTKDKLLAYNELAVLKSVTVVEWKWIT